MPRATANASGRPSATAAADADSQEPVGTAAASTQAYGLRPIMAATIGPFVTDDEVRAAVAAARQLDHEHPLYLEGLDLAQDQFFPMFTIAPAELLLTRPRRYLGIVAVTGLLTKPLLGRRPTVLSTLLGPGLLLGVGILAEWAVRCVAMGALMFRALLRQRSAMLADVKTDFALAIPHEMERETRITNATVYVAKGSFGITPIWFRRLRLRGWTWSTDLRHWQSVRHHKSTGGAEEGLLPVRSNRWLLRRLHMRDVRARVRPPRPVNAPPPLSLPDCELDDAPADFLCPIAHTVMTDPVVGPAGVSYERSALMQWLRLKRTDPSTQGRLEMGDCYANLNLRSQIAAWAKAREADAARQADHNPEAHRDDGDEMKGNGSSSSGGGSSTSGAPDALSTSHGAKEGPAPVPRPQGKKKQRVAHPNKKSRRGPAAHDFDELD